MTVAKQSLSQEKMYDILVRPLVTEKSTQQAAYNQYTFEVLKHATKPQVKKAVESIFKVTVEAVNTISIKGKTKRFRGRIGKRADYKKAVVRLKQGQTIDFSAGK